MSWNSDDSVLPPAAGLVLAGGQGRRMGGPKAGLRLAGKTLLGRALAILETSSLSPLVVVASPGQLLPRELRGARVVRDRVPGQGPLQALADGLAAVAGEREVAFVAACDMPLLDPGFVLAVRTALGSARGAVPLDEIGRPQPLAAAYRVDLETDLRGLLANGRRAVRAVAGLPGVCRLEWAFLEAAGASGALTNLNRPEELPRMRRLLEDRSGRS